MDASDVATLFQRRELCRLVHHQSDHAGAGQTWDTSELATSGAIKVVGGSSGPQFGGIVVADGNVIPCGTGGLNFSVAQQFFQIELP